jgi:hypothetical protein
MAIIHPPGSEPAHARVAPLEAPLRPLCPACHTTVVRVSVAAAVVFDVVCADAHDGERDLQVISHEWLDACWDADARAACATCDWQGSVAELRRG